MISFFHFLRTKNTFEGKLPKEKTLLLKRRHWFVIFLPFLIFIFFLLLPIVGYFLIRNFSWFEKISSLFWFGFSIYFLFLWISLGYALMRYFLTVIIVTNERIINIETKGFFKYERAEAQLKNIQDVAIKIYGIFGTILNFGNLEIQTAGRQVKFIFTQLPDPEKIKKIIMTQKIVSNG